MDHLQRTREEFSRQADRFAASPALSDAAQVSRLVTAVGGLEGCRVLDVACGPGIVSCALAAKAREVVALDLTPRMLEKARERCAKAGLSNVVFREGQVTELPFADNEFDAVVTRLSIHHFTEPQLAVAEMRRVLRPGGVLAIADVVSSEDTGKSELQNAIEILRDPSHTRMLPTSELLALMTRDGLTIEHKESWDRQRDFDEWLGIVADPLRAEPLRTLVHALAALGEDAGMGLRVDGEAIHLFHRWLVVTARKV